MMKIGKDENVTEEKENLKGRFGLLLVYVNCLITYLTITERHLPLV